MGLRDPKASSPRRTVADAARMMHCAGRCEVVIRTGALLYMHGNVCCGVDCLVGDFASVRSRKQLHRDSPSNASDDHLRILQVERSRLLSRVHVTRVGATPSLPRSRATVHDHSRRQSHRHLDSHRRRHKMPRSSHDNQFPVQAPSPGVATGSVAYM
jgi:hypothetical protein